MATKKTPFGRRRAKNYVYPFRLDAEEVDALKREAKRQSTKDQKVTVADVLRDAIDAHLKKSARQRQRKGGRS